MVAQAPDLSSLRASLRRLIGDHPVVGHNVSFDLAFLKAAHAGQGNQRLDTVTLSSILLPRLGRYSLGRVAAHLALPTAPDGIEAAHRALGDARRTALLFQKLLYLARVAPRFHPPPAAAR